MAAAKKQSIAVDFESLPSPLKRHKSIDGLRSAWLKLQRSVCSPTVLHGMPAAIEYLATAIYDTEPGHALRAIQHGDPAFFVAILMRLHQIDTALIAAGRTLADRSPIVYAKHIVDGFREAAEKRFVERGGVVGD